MKLSYGTLINNLQWGTLSICRQGKHGGAAGVNEDEDMVDNVDLLDATRPGSWLAIASTSF